MSSRSGVAVTFTEGYCTPLYERCTALLNPVGGLFWLVVRPVGFEPTTLGLEAPPLLAVY